MTLNLLRTGIDWNDNRLPSPLDPWTLIESKITRWLHTWTSIDQDGHPPSVYQESQKQVGEDFATKLLFPTALRPHCSFQGNYHLQFALPRHLTTNDDSWPRNAVKIQSSGSTSSFWNSCHVLVDQNVIQVPWIVWDDVQSSLESVRQGTKAL